VVDQGVAGLIQSGGFERFSEAYGMAAASLSEVEIVTFFSNRRWRHRNLSTSSAALQPSGFGAKRPKFILGPLAVISIGHGSWLQI
jgi:hypothetical protein